MDISALQPIVVYGSNVSYFTGKLENYFHLKGVPYRLQSMQLPGDHKWIQEKLGLWQMPVVGLGDGRWMTDTTVIIQWFEQHYPDNPVLPADPLQAFVLSLIHI